MRLPSELLDGQGRLVRIHRAWPRSDGGLVVEGREADNGRLRAGRVDARGRTLLVPFRTDRSLPGLTPDTPRGELLVHRLKRRAVVRTQGQYRKFIAGGKASSVADAHLSASIRLAGSGLTVPDVVAADDFSVTLTAVPGLSLHELGQSLHGPYLAPDPAPDTARSSVQLDRWHRAWKLWADQWPHFVATATEGPSTITRSHAASDEAATVGRWTGLAVGYGALGVSDDRVRDAFTSVARRLMAGDSARGLAHRDLHDKQILADPGAGSVGIIDCDTLTMAEPALDLANLSVHLDFRVAQGLLQAGDAAVGKLSIRAVAESLHVPDERFNAYAAATALRLACIYAFRPPYRDVAHAWFSAVEAHLRLDVGPHEAAF